MKEEAILLVALLVLALPLAAAQDSGTAGISDSVTDDNGLGGSEAVDVSASTTAPVLAALGVLGKGIAVSSSDPMDFFLVKIGLGAVRVTVAGQARTAAIGVLFADGTRYRLKSVSVVDGHATGDIYGNASGTEALAGSFDISSVEKDGVEVWAGTMTLSGTVRSLYVIEGARQVRAQELGDKVADYCRNNPNDTNCGDKVGQFCQSNPDDARCKALFRSYCIAGRNMDDARCREYVSGYCTDNSTLKECVAYGVLRAKSYCESNPGSALCARIDDRLVGFCQSNPDNEGCIRAKEAINVSTQLANRLAQVVTKRLSSLPRNESAAVARELSRVRIATGGG
jgi:hypothetical protein